LQRTLSPLLEEHQLIRRVASALEWLSLRFGSSSLVDEDFLASLNVLLDYIISCHHSKEEAILFPSDSLFREALWVGKTLALRTA